MSDYRDEGNKRLSRGLRHIFNDTSDGAIRDPGSGQPPRRHFERAMPTMLSSTPAPASADRYAPLPSSSAQASARAGRTVPSRPIAHGPAAGPASAAGARAHRTPGIPGSSLNQFRGFPSTGARAPRTNARAEPGTGARAGAARAGGAGAASAAGAGTGGIPSAGPNARAHGGSVPTAHAGRVPAAGESPRMAMLRNREWQSKTLREVNQVLRETGFTGQLINPVLDQRPPFRVIAQMVYALYRLLNSNTDTTEQELWNRLSKYLQTMGYAYARELAVSACIENPSSSTAWKYILAAMAWMVGQYKAMLEETRTMDVPADEDLELVRLKQMESRLVAKAFEVSRTGCGAGELQHMQNEVESALTVWENDLRESLRRAQTTLAAKQAQISELSDLDRRSRDIQEDFDKVELSEQQCVQMVRDCDKLLADARATSVDQEASRQQLDADEDQLNQELARRGVSVEKAHDNHNVRVQLSNELRAVAMESYNRQQARDNAEVQYQIACTALKNEAVLYNHLVAPEKRLDVDEALARGVHQTANQIMGFRLSEFKDSLNKAANSAHHSKRLHEQLAESLEATIAQMVEHIATTRAEVEKLQNQLTVDQEAATALEEAQQRDLEDSQKLLQSQQEQNSAGLKVENDKIAGLKKLLQDVKATTQSVEAQRTEVLDKLRTRLKKDRSMLHKAQTRFTAAISQFSDLSSQLEERTRVEADLAAFKDPVDKIKSLNVTDTVKEMIGWYDKNVAASFSV